jgi:NarL family two-component system response regulator LiaR
MPLRVLIVDDHPVVRQGLAALIATSPEFQVAGTAATGPEAVAAARGLQPDLVLLDLILGQENGVQVLPRILAAAPATRVLVLTSYTDADLVEPALRAGAAGYLLKTAAADDVLDSMRRIAGGGRVLDPAAQSALRELSGDDLTPREREVLHLVAEGLTNAEIAERLTITVRTVKAHISNLLTKLQVTDRTQLAIYELHRRGRAGGGSPASPP